jgi:hypothetical protein
MPIIELDYQRVLNLANGVPTYGYTVNAAASAYPLSALYTDTGPALTYLATQGFTVTNIIAENAKVIWFLSHA